MATPEVNGHDVRHDERHKRHEFSPGGQPGHQQRNVDEGEDDRRPKTDRPHDRPEVCFREGKMDLTKGRFGVSVA